MNKTNGEARDWRGDYADYCGCCGRRMDGRESYLSYDNGDWCTDCSAHVLPHSFGAPWDRTYYAQHRKSCPYDLYPVEDGESLERLRRESR